MRYAANHSGCTDVPDYQEGQKRLLDDAQIRKSCARKSALADRALLIRLTLCGRWGRMMRDFYGVGNEMLIAATDNADGAGPPVGNSLTGVTSERGARACVCLKPNTPDVGNPPSCLERDIAPSKSSAIRRVALA